MSWPIHFPENCPPNAATSVAGITLYRATKTNPASAADFQSGFTIFGARFASPTHLCLDCGLSVFADEAHIHEMALRVPALRSKHVAALSLSDADGVTLQTPTKNSANHATWWTVSPLEDLLNKCIIVGKT